MRTVLVVEIRQDPISGWGDSPEDHKHLVQKFLDEAIPHYNPKVEIFATVRDNVRCL